MLKVDGIAPSVKQIQTAMSAVIERFKAIGYIPKKNSLERVPDADMFVLECVENKPLGPYDLTKYTCKEADTPVQELYTFKPYKCAESFNIAQADFDKQGNCIRRIGSAGKGDEVLSEYEYIGDKVVKETRYESIYGKTYKTEKVIDPQTGNYTEEFIGDSKFRKIAHYDNQNRRTKTTTIHDFGSVKYTTNEIIDPQTGKVTQIEEEVIDFTHFSEPTKFVEKCEIDPNTNKISKYYHISPDGSVYEMFERDKTGQVTHFISRGRVELKYDPQTGNGLYTSKNFVNDSDPKTETISEGYYMIGRFMENLRQDICSSMKKYL
ncbi:MAG: hypothetical protein ACI37Q_02415 [Candidatus Gastranaerophilaceae bacterium]